MQIGIQVSSLKPLLTTPEQVRLAFREMARLDCRVAQLQWIDKTVPGSEIAASMEAVGMKSLGVQDFYTLIREDPEYYVNLNKATGGRWLCISRIPEECKSPEGLNRFRRELEELERCLESRGQRLCFHPVAADYRAVPGMDPVAWLMEQIPELELCLDLYHLDKCCDDMPGYIRRFSGRICMVHFKDARGETLVPAGQGDVNWQGVVRACLDARVPYGLAEQERWEGDPYLCLAEAMTWAAGQ